MTEIALSGHSDGVTALAAPAPSALAASAPVEALGFDAAYHQCFDPVWRTLRRLGVDSSSLDDAAQEVFLAVHRRLGDFDGLSSLRTWVVGIAVRVAADFRRRHRRKQAPTEALHPGLLDERPGPLELAARAEALRMLDSVLCQLKDGRREVFVLAELERMTAPEISAALGVNVNTIYSRLRLARRDFEAALRRREGGEP